MNNVFTLINERVSASSYVKDDSIEITDIEKLISFATKAPSAFNLQNWRFYCSEKPRSQTTLVNLSYNQAKVVESAVTFIICGTKNPQDLIAENLKPSVEQGILTQEIFDGWVCAVNNM